jgi:hypothetical protein
MDEMSMETPCACFGDRLRRRRKEVGMGPKEFAVLMGSPGEMVDEVERGLRAVCRDCVLKADQVLEGDGLLPLMAGDSLHYQAWGARRPPQPLHAPGPRTDPAAGRLRDERCVARLRSTAKALGNNPAVAVPLRWVIGWASVCTAAAPLVPVA